MIWKYLSLFINTGQVDLWTRKSNGCPCSWATPDKTIMTDLNNNNNDGGGGGVNSNSLDQSCACCVTGGCQCGENSPARCGQCGLEQYCINSKNSFF